MHGECRVEAEDARRRRARIGEVPKTQDKGLRAEQVGLRTGAREDP